jgi:endoglucanase
MNFRLCRRDALAALAALGGLASIGPVRATPFSLPETMRRGFNLPDQAPLRLEYRPQQRTLKSLRALGMTHVRLPVIADYVLAEMSGPQTMSSALDDMTAAVDNLLGLGYSVSVDLQPGADFLDLQRRDAATANRYLLQGWPKLAQRLKRWPPERVFAELLNEPATTDAVWRPFVEKLAQSVRAVLPRTPIIVCSAPYQRMDALTGWRPLADDRIVYACHYYDPMPFTHQGAIWDNSALARASGVPFPSAQADPRILDLLRKAQRAGDTELEDELRNLAAQAWNARKINSQFAELGQWSARRNVPVIINEFGVLKWKAKRADRLAWLRIVRSAAEAQGFGWAHWDYMTSFGLLDDNGEIDEGLMRALFDPIARSAAPSVSPTRPITTGSDSGTK